jgi:catechol 2,3-dioxygenase-like lactoylglutathione lyase family enzyme
MRVVTGLLLGLAASAALAQHDSPRTAAAYLWQPGMAASEIGEVNVFRRFSSDRAAAMREFYGAVLALPVLPDSALGGGQMIRYPVGRSEVKLFPVTPSPANTLAVNEAIGVRLLTFFYADRAVVEARFVAHGLPAPRFATDTSRARSTASALVQDPDGEWVELVIVPGADADTLARFEIGIVAADLAASRAFYADVLGLTAQAPVRDGRLGADRYAFTHGTTTINLYSYGADLPKDAATGGMQYIVWDVAGVAAVVHERGARIDRPLSAPGRMRTLWLLDPDGISNYFAEFAGNDNAAPR